MTDERLSEARKALARYEDRNSKPNPAHLAHAVRGLIALVEEALTPTNDERERAERLVARLLPARQTPGTAANIVRYLTEAGLLRRTEVPEPSAEEFRRQIAEERERQIECGYDAEHDRAHGVDHLLRWAQDYARRGRSVQSAALIEAAREMLREDAK